MDATVGAESNKRATPGKDCSKGRFHAHDPLIVTKPKRKNKKAKPNLPVMESKKKAVHEEKQVAKQVQEDEKQQQAPIAGARRYQKVILEKSLQENTIVYLETGCGKTLIAVLLIKELASLLREKNEKFSAIFLAPTIFLVEQQTEVLKINTDLQVDSCYGSKGVDYWSGTKWKEQMDANEVLVMTPMVFLDALRHGFLKMESFEILIFDECHQAQKQHPYAKIMREYYHKLRMKRPKVFGMTASPVTSKGVVSTEDSAKQMQQLESLLDAKVYTLEDKSELESFVPTPVQMIKRYMPPRCSSPFLMQKLDVIRDKYEGHYDSVMTSGDGFKDVEELAKKLWKRIKKLHGCLQYSLEELGLWCAFESANCLLKKIKTDVKYDEDDDEVMQNSKEAFLKEALQVLEAAILEENPKPINCVSDGLAATEKGFLTSKVLLLVECLLEYKNVKDLHCIVFVERVVTAMVLAKILSRISCLSFLTCGFLAGTTASLDVMGKKQQQSTLDQFRAGRINVLVATDVAEEGLDVQSCSSVIRFDLSRTVRSYIQSRGRARKPGSDYVIFLEEDNQKQYEQLLDLMQSEESMRDQALNRTHHSIPVEKIRAEDVEFFRVESTGATVNIDSSISLITRFCSNLPGDKYYRPQPEFIFEKIEGEDTLHVCRLILPPNGPFRELIGPPKRSRGLAKQSVCFEACKKLHLMGQITDHLIPVIDVEKPEEEEVMNISGKNVAGAGTNKRKELHATAATDALSGDWINRSEDLLLHAYILCFTFCPEEDNPYADFVLLVNALIDDDIANIEVPIYLTNDRVAIAKIFAAGTYSLSADQLKEAKSYHELIFNGMFGKLLRHSKKSEGASPISKMRNLLACQSALDEMWNHLHMYLLLPLIPGKLAEESEVIPIDWKAVRDTAMTANVFSALCSTQGSNKSHKSSVYSAESESMHSKDMVHMACGSKAFSKVRGMAVVTIHTGRIYSVVEVLEDKNANCPIEGVQDTKSSIYSSYAHYFAEKYKRVLKYPHQPLLQVKQTHRLHNLLTGDVTNSKKKKNSTEKVKRSILVEIPPELCLCIGISNAVIRSLYLFPSVLHRFNALLLAGQLRSKIAKDMPQCSSIRPTVVMEALTTLRCLEGFSSEELELLGDSFLKYAVSRYLYLVYDKKHEGQLTARRCRAICNERLHCLAIANHLPVYIRDEPFQPELWHAPGMFCPKSVTCKCNLENLTCHENIYEKGEQEANKVFRIGKTCSKGHRWICSKTVSDAVEALIGAFIVCGGSGPALGFMKWMGMEIDFDLSLYKDARDRCNVHPKVLNGINITGLETQLDYVFWNKSLLVEALTHASQQDPYGGCCYQRLEFLGDAVLDFLITRHLFLAHPGLSPGILSDLRSAAVNNECFARSAVKHNLQRYLRHGSGELLSQITNFVKAVQVASEAGQDQLFGWEGVHGPKVLGDLVESIAGAILVDSGFDLDRVWSVMERLLSPLVTPSTLPLHPIRELHEVSQYRRFPFTWKKTQKKGKLSLATAEVEVDNEVITKTASGQRKKTAKKDAAQQVLYALMSRGICHRRRQVANQGNCTMAVPNTPTHIRTIQASEKRSFDSDAGGSNEKRRKLACDESTFENGGLHCREEVKPMDILELNQSTSKKHESKGLGMNGNCCTKEEMVDSSEDKKSLNIPDLAIGFGDKKSVETDLLEHAVLLTVADRSNSINLKTSPSTLSKSEDERSLSCYDSSSMLQPLFQSLRKAPLTDYTECTPKNPGVKEPSKALMKGVDVDLHADSGEFSVRILGKGCGRSRLNEFCIKNRWTGPVYELIVQEGKSHVEMFTFSAAVDGPFGPIKFTSDPMPRKNQAKDNAAVKVLMALVKKFST